MLRAAESAEVTYYAIAGAANIFLEPQAQPGSSGAGAAAIDQGEDGDLVGAFIRVPRKAIQMLRPLIARLQLSMLQQCWWRIFCKMGAGLLVAS